MTHYAWIVVWGPNHFRYLPTRKEARDFAVWLRNEGRFAQYFKSKHLRSEFGF